MNLKDMDNRALLRTYTNLMTTFERLPNAHPKMMDEAQEIFNEILKRMRK